MYNINALGAVCNMQYPELATDRVLGRGWFVALRTTLVHATDDDDDDDDDAILK